MTVVCASRAALLLLRSAVTIAVVLQAVAAAAPAPAPGAAGGSAKSPIASSSGAAPLGISYVSSFVPGQGFSGAQAHLTSLHGIGFRQVRAPRRRLPQKLRGGHDPHIVIATPPPACLRAGGAFCIDAAPRQAAAADRPPCPPAGGPPRGAGYPGANIPVRRPQPHRLLLRAFACRPHQHDCASAGSRLARRAPTPPPLRRISLLLRTSEPKIVPRAAVQASTLW